MGNIMTTTVIKNASWVVAWDDAAGSHQYLKNTDVVFQGGRMTQVGGSFDRAADTVIHGEGLMVMPGLIDTHSHPMSEIVGRGFSEDVGNPKLGMSGLYDYMPAYGPVADGYLSAAEATYCELLLSGVTTLADLSVPYDGWVDLMAQSGLRSFVSPMFRSARWYTENGHEVKYQWAEDGGAAAFGRALKTIDKAMAHPSGRLSAIMTPSQIETCTPELFAQAKDAARERGIRVQTHAAQSMVEFNEITRRHGMTPIQWLRELDLLGPEFIIAHGIFLDTHSWVTWGSRDDLDILAESGSHIAHCPNVFFKHGIMLESFAEYRKRGINIGLGTDTFPHNIIEEMRLAGMLSRVATRRVEQSTSSQIFDAATIGGATLLGRDDIGRLKVGAKADLVLVDINHPAMRPVRDPVRSLIFTAADRAVRDVYIDGNLVVGYGKVLTMDHTKALDQLDGIRTRAEQKVPELDWGGRSGEQMSPLTFPVSKSQNDQCSPE
jgi:5-methylthioadenosine/S-adenosylhomocysteine deaminase